MSTLTLPADARATTNPCANPRPDITKDAAIALMLSRVRPVDGVEVVALGEALGRVLAEPLIAPGDLPRWDNSAMDGYAVSWSDMMAHGGRLRVTQRIPAGAVGKPLAPGEAARIFTGAPVPDGADTVVIQERCRRAGEHVVVPLDAARGGNIRRAGEDMRAGTPVLEVGARLAPQHLGVAASLGLTDVLVRRRLRVAIAVTGDELVPPGTPLGPGQIYNSNRFTLAGLLDGFGCEVIDLGIVTDSASATEAALVRGAREADLVLSSGGVSVGEEDHVKPVLRRIGALDFGSVAVRPGKAMVFGRIGDTPFFGAPGNPVALFVAVSFFVRPVVLRLQGVAGDPRPAAFAVPAGFDRPEPGRRPEYHRGRIRTGADGVAEVEVYPKRSSAILSSVTWADGFVEMPEGRAIRRGDPLAFLPLSAILS